MRSTKEILRASVEKDAATLERLIGERFVLYSAGGKSFGKAALIKLWTTKSENPPVGESSAADEFQISIFGATGIVFSTITDVSGGKTTRTKAFDVWQKTRKGWRWIASRETLLPPETQ